MKKTIIITAIALCVSITALNAKESIDNFNSTRVEMKTDVSPFCKAIAKGDFETVKKMIELGADINKKSAGLTPAMYAARFNKVEILKLLISKGADLKAKSDTGFTAKRYAEISNAFEAKAVIEKHLKKGARA